MSKLWRQCLGKRRSTRAFKMITESVSGWRALHVKLRHRDSSLSNLSSFTTFLEALKIIIIVLPEEQTWPLDKLRMKYQRQDKGRRLPVLPWPAKIEFISKVELGFFQIFTLLMTSSSRLSPNQMTAGLRSPLHFLQTGRSST